MTSAIEARILDSFSQLSRGDQRAVVKRLSKREKHLVKRMLRRVAAERDRIELQQAKPSIKRLFSARLSARLDQIINENKSGELSSVTPVIVELIEEFLAENSVARADGR